MEIKRDDSDENYILLSWGPVNVYIARDEYHMIWFENWDSLEILQESEMSMLAELLIQAQAEAQKMSM